MQPLATTEDVDRLLDAPLEQEEVEHVELLIEEASDLVRAYTGKDFLEDVPGGVKRVTARMVVRTLAGGDSGAPVGMTSENQSAGVFSHSRSFEAGSTDGGVWLSRQDKIKLRRWKGGAYSIKTW